MLSLSHQIHYHTNTTPQQKQTHKSNKKEHNVVTQHQQINKKLHKHQSTPTFKQQKPPGYWNLKHNQVTFMMNVAKCLQVIRWEDWYTITSKQITDEGGSRLLAKYNESPMQLIQSIYPEYPWKVSHSHLL